MHLISNKSVLIALPFVVIVVGYHFMAYHSHDKEICDKITQGMTVEHLRTLALNDLKEPSKFNGTGHFLVGSVLTYGCDIAVDNGVVTSAKYKLMD